jgi:chromosome segregation ATPase
MLKILKSGKNLIDNVPEKVRDLLLKMNKNEKSKSTDVVHVNAELLSGKSKTIQANDRISEDFLSEVERFIKNREVLLLSNIETKDQLDHVEQRMEKLLQEKDKLIYQFIDKEEEIKGLEEKLTKNHQLFDKLHGEYRELQLLSSTEISELKSEIEVETHKYNQLVQEFKAFRANATKENDALQERIRRLDAKNEDLREQYQVKVEENAKLVKSINQFSDQFTFTALNKKEKKPSKPAPDVPEKTADKQEEREEEE